MIKLKKKALKPRIRARIRKGKIDINSQFKNFFEWIKGAEIVELNNCNIKEDPVRLELSLTPSYGKNPIQVGLVESLDLVARRDRACFFVQTRAAAPA